MSADTHQGRRRARRILSPYLVLLGTLTLTVVATYYASVAAEAKDRLRFENVVRSLQDGITNHLDTQIALLRSGSALFAARRERVTPEEFRTFVERLELPKSYPGVMGIGFAQRTTSADERRALIEEARRAGIADYQISPEGDRPESFPIIYLEPLDARNRAALGYDMYSEPVRRAAMERARDTGLPAASGRVTLLQEIDGRKQPGFLIYLPVYRGGQTPAGLDERRALLDGFIYSPFRAGDLLRGALGGTAPASVRLRVYDSEGLNAENLLHDSQDAAGQTSRPAGEGTSAGADESAARYSASNRIEVAGRLWTLHFTSEPEFTSASERALVYLLPIGGLLFGLILFFVTRSLANERAAAERAVQSLAESEMRFRTVVEQSPLSMQIFSPEGRTIQVNQAWEKLWGVTLEQIGDYRILEDPQLAAKGILPYIRQAFDGVPSSVPAILYNPEETIPGITTHEEPGRWVQAFIYPVKDEEGRILQVVLVHEDITERRQAEEKLRYQLNLNTAITSHVAEGLFMTDSQGRTTFMNPAAEEILGWTMEELKGRILHDSIHYQYPDGSPFPKSECPLNDVLSGGQTVQSREDLWFRRDGSPIDVFCSCAPIIVGTEVTGIVLAFHDISERKRVEEALRESEMRYRTFAETASDAIMTIDEESTIILINAAAEKIFGYTTGEMLGSNLTMLMPDYLRHLHREGVSRYLETGKKHISWAAVELPGLHKSGREIPLELSFGEYTRHGHPYFTGIVRDITRRKETEEALHLAERRAITEYEALLERLVPLAQALGTARELDTIFRALLDFSLASMPCIGLFISLYDPARDLRTAVFAWAEGADVDVTRLPPMPVGDGPNSRAVRTNQIIITDDYPSATEGHPSVKVGVDNGLMPRSSIAAPMSVMGRIVGTIEVQSYEPANYTKEHATALGMASNLAAVAIENLRLFELERRARGEAEEASRLKDEFLATVSHELRTPLTAILGWTRLMRSENFDTRMQPRALETIERNARAQTKLIDDLLDVSRIITGKLRLSVQPVELSAIISSAIESARPAAVAKEVRLDVRLDQTTPPISGDPDRLQQIVWNLLTNAIKFTPPGGQVTVRLARRDGQAEVVVADTGAGISREFLPHLFERFRQADGGITRIHGGLGIGLSIVRHLVELHGGTIHAESAGQNLGATFTVKLPLIRLAQSQSEPQPEALTAAAASTLPHPSTLVLQDLRVLVVEDERDTLDLLAEVLRQAGAEVSTAVSVSEAFESFRRAAPDTVVSDIGMPYEDGYQLIRRIRALAPEEGGEVTAIALTAYARSEDRARAFSEGFQAHVAKPIEPAELIGTIARLAGRSARVN